MNKASEKQMKENTRTFKDGYVSLDDLSRKVKKILHDKTNDFMWLKCVFSFASIADSLISIIPCITP